MQQLERTLQQEPARFDVAIELARLQIATNRYAAATTLLDEYAGAALQHPHYANMAGEGYFAMGKYDQAQSLFDTACVAQPDVAGYAMNRAAAAVYLGDIDTAREIYRSLLQRHPRNQKVHYELSQLARAKNDKHIRQMQKVLKKNDPDPAKNVFLHYALGKEYEDLGRWKRAFHHLQTAGDAAKRVSGYNVHEDVELMQAIAASCTREWLQQEPVTQATSERVPVFVVGLPRTGTTLTERILSSHPLVQSIGETQLLQMVLRDGNSAGNAIGITPQLIEAAAARNAKEIGDAYLDAVTHKLGDETWFVEKLPENFLYLGFIAKAWPQARIVHLRRHPLDACFAMYKQPYFRFAYALDDLADYFVAYDRLRTHWQQLLGDRVVEVEYEALVADSDIEIRALLERLGLPFDTACLDFNRNRAPVATASSVQVREKVHSRSVGKWQRFAVQLEPLRARLVAADIDLGEV